MLDRAGLKRLAEAMLLRPVILCCLACLGGCSTLPAEMRLSPAAGAAAQGYPALVPLGGLVAEADAVPPRSAESDGQSLAARAAELRRRAALLRDMPL